MQKGNKHELLLWHSWLGRCPGWPPPRAVFIFSVDLGNLAGWIDTSFYTPFGNAPGGCIRGPGVDCEGRFCFMKFSGILTIHTCDPGAPSGPLGSHGVRRNLAISRRAPQASSWPLGALKWIFEILVARHGALRGFTIVVIHYFDLGAPQGSRGPLGITELFSGTLVVHRIALGGPQGPFGFPRGFGGWRPHRSTSYWHLVNAPLQPLEFGKSPSKKGCSISAQVLTQRGKFDAYIGFALRFKHLGIGIGTNLVRLRGKPQTMEGFGSDFIGIRVVDFLDNLTGDSGGDNNFPNNVNDLPNDSCDFIVLRKIDLLDAPGNDSNHNLSNNNHDFQISNSSLCYAACFIEVLEFATTTTDKGF